MFRQYCPTWVGVNGGTPINGDLPFGGYKHSGVGRAWGTEGIEEYLETKVIACASSAGPDAAS